MLKTNYKKFFFNYKENICSVEEMLKYFDKIDLKSNVDDKKVGKYYFYYYLARSFVRRFKEIILYLIKGKHYRNYREYHKEKMKNFKSDEVVSKFNSLITLNNETLNDYKVNEIIPRIFCFEKVASN